jgi:hypothetical protein
MRRAPVRHVAVGALLFRWQDSVRTWTHPRAGGRTLIPLPFPRGPRVRRPSALGLGFDHPRPPHRFPGCKQMYRNQKRMIIHEIPGG